MKLIQPGPGLVWLHICSLGHHPNHRLHGCKPSSQLTSRPNHRLHGCISSAQMTSRRALRHLRGWKSEESCTTYHRRHVHGEMCEIDLSLTRPLLSTSSCSTTSQSLSMV